MDKQLSVIKHSEGAFSIRNQLIRHIFETFSSVLDTVTRGQNK